MTQLSKSNKTIEDLDNFALTNRPYVATTDNIQVMVWPEFIDSKSSIIGDLFVWAYHVRIDNQSTNSMKLINRYWRIIDEKGIVQEVNGEGVIGEQPTIVPGGFYQYSSGVHLRYPSGIMTGRFQMKKTDSDEISDVTIPTFSLDVPSVKNVIN